MNQTIFTGPCPGNSPSPPPAGGWCDSGRLQSSNSFVAKWKRCRFRQALEIFWIVLTYLELSWIILKYLELSWNILNYLDISWFILKYLEVSWNRRLSHARLYKTLPDVTRRYQTLQLESQTLGDPVARHPATCCWAWDLSWVSWARTIQWDDDPRWCSISMW